MRCSVLSVFSILLAAACGGGGGGGGGGGETAAAPPGKAIAGGSGFAASATGDGGYIIVGTLSPGGSGGTDMDLVKIDATGKVTWSGRYGGNGDDRGYFVQPTLDGGYIVVGETASAIGNGPGLYMIKTGSDGAPQWENTYPGLETLKHSEGAVVRQTADGGYVIAGTVPGTEFNPEPDATLIKADADGNPVWQKYFGISQGNLWVEGYDVRQTSDGGYMLVGYHEFAGSFAVKLDSNGVAEWEQAFGQLTGPIYSVQQTADGGYIYIGRYESGGTACAALLVKADSSGNRQFEKTVGALTSCPARVTGMQTADEGYVIATRGNNRNGDAYVVKTDASGDEQWARLYGGDGEDAASAIVQRADGGYTVVGTTSSFGSTPQVYFLQLDASGNTQ
jgi:hypothetical protein